MKFIVITIIGSLMVLFNTNSALSAIVTAEPDDFSEGTVLDNAFPGITLERFGCDYWKYPVTSEYSPYATTGMQAFGIMSYCSFVDFNIYFKQPTNYFSIDLIGIYYDYGPVYGAIVYYDVYDINNVIIDVGWSTELQVGQSKKLVINNPTAYISKVSFYAEDDSGVALDNLQYNLVPEPISSTLFIIGAGLLAGRRYLRRRK